MAMRLQEIHPSLVHFPIVLLPAALLADAAGRLTGSEALMSLGKRTMPAAAAGGLLAGLFGFIAQQSVELDKQSTKMLITHRNLNVSVVGAACLLAWKRAQNKKPSLTYFAAGLAAVGTITYTAYLGGHMVYERGVGVKPAGGLRLEAAPEITRETAERAAKLAGRHLLTGVQVAAEEVGRGELAPLLASGEGTQPAPPGATPT